MKSATAIIPARGGSRGIPHKNRALVGGKPLLEWSIEAARGSNRVQRILVTTDCPEIAELAKSLGAEVPFLRPAHLAKDDTPGIDPILHALEFLGHETTSITPWIVQLQPTSPLRIAEDIDTALDLAEQKTSDSVISVVAASTHPFWMQRIDHQGCLEPLMNPGAEYTRRQDLPPAYALNGAICAARAETLRERRSFRGKDTVAYVMPAERSVDIDTPYDLELADWLLRRRDESWRAPSDCALNDADDPVELALGEAGRGRETDRLVIQTIRDITSQRR